MTLNLKFKNSRGQAAVEVAIAIVFLLALLLFAWDMTMVSYNWSGLQFAVNEGLRVGAQSSIFNASEVESYTRTIAERLGITNPNVAATLSEGRLSIRSDKTVNFTPLTRTVFQLTNLGDGLTVHAFAQRRQEP